MLERADGRIAFRFHARDVHLVMGPRERGASVPFRVLVDGEPPGDAHGLDVDEQGNGTLAEQRLYQLIRQPGPIADRTFEITFLAAASRPTSSRSASSTAVKKCGHVDEEHGVTPRELFFDLVFVFAFTQVTTLLAHDPTFGGIGRGVLVLAALWWPWTAYAWLTNNVDPEEGFVGAALLVALIAMFVAALAVPGVFTDEGVLFGAAFLVVVVMHLALYALAGRGKSRSPRGGASARSGVAARRVR